MNGLNLKKESLYAALDELNDLGINGEIMDQLGHYKHVFFTSNLGNGCLSFKNGK